MWFQWFEDASKSMAISLCLHSLTSQPEECKEMDITKNIYLAFGLMTITNEADVKLRGSLGNIYC
jgi:hypothetical protein